MDHKALRPLPHLGLHHVALYVRDIKISQHFYVELLGFAVEWQPDAENLYLSSGLDNLALHQQKKSNNEKSPSYPTLDHIGLVVADVEQVQIWQNFLSQHGVKILHPTRSHRDLSTSCLIADPDGIAIQIIYHPPLSPTLKGVVRKSQPE